MVERYINEFCELYFGSVEDEYGECYSEVYDDEFGSILRDLFDYTFKVRGTYGDFNELDVFGAIRMRINECFHEIPSSEATYVIVDLLNEYNRDIAVK